MDDNGVVLTRNVSNIGRESRRPMIRLNSISRNPNPFAASADAPSPGSGMVRPLSARRRPAAAPQICAAATATALLLLLSLLFLHSRLSSSPLPLSLGLRSALPHHPSGDDPLPDETSAIDDLESNGRRTAEDDEDLDDDIDSDEPEPDRSPGYFWDHAAGVARRSFRRQEQQKHRSVSLSSNQLVSEDRDRTKMAFGSDDQPVDEDVRVKLDSIRRIEDALLLKTGSGSSPLRDGWARWLEGKADFLRRDRMLRSNLEMLNPKNHPLLQDPDMPGLTSLTRGDRLMQRAILKDMENMPFPGGSGGGEVKGVELRKTLGLQEDAMESHLYADGRRWGYFPALDPHLTFSEFMDRFLESGRCRMRVFMVWNSPPWMYGVRHQRSLESLLYHNKDACVVMLSETMDLDFFKDFVKDGYKIAVVMPNLDELLKDTPTHVFASLWFEWRKTKYYPIHYSELVRLAALYKYGGVYLDSDIIVLRRLNSLENSIGLEDQMARSSSFNGAVMAFKRHSPFLMNCLEEFYSTYDDNHLRWNGANLLTRVFNRLHSTVDNSKGQLKLESPGAFFPISYMNITRYFVAATDETERARQDSLFRRILNESTTFHFWNALTSSLVPEPSSLVERLLNQYCLHCLDLL